MAVWEFVMSEGQTISEGRPISGKVLSAMQCTGLSAARHLKREEF